MTGPAIVVDGLRRCCGKVVALDGPSFDVAAGQPPAFGGAIHVVGTNYVNYLMPGIFAQSVAFGAMGTAVGSGRCSLAAPALDGADRGRSARAAEERKQPGPCARIRPRHRLAGAGASEPKRRAGPVSSGLRHCPHSPRRTTPA